MATLKEVRSAFPEYAEVPDDVLSEALYKKFGEGQDKADFLLELKGRGPRIGPVKASYEGLKSSSQTGIARLLYAAGAEETAKEMQQRSEERQQDVADRYQPAVSSYKDVTGPLSAGQYLYEGIAQSIPSMGAMAAGAAAGAAAGSVIPGVGTLAGGTIGAGLALFPSYIGGNIQAQMEEGKKFEETSLPAAATAAAGQTAADVVAGKLLLRAFPGLGAPGGTSRLLNSARRGVEGMAAEAPTEAIQDALEIMQANPNKFFEFGPEVQDRIINAAILGGGAGFLIGGTGGALSRPAPKVAPPKGEAGTAEQPPANLATKVGVEPPPEQAATEPVETEPTGTAAAEPGSAAEPGATTEPVAAEPPVETAPAPRIAPEPTATVEPGTTVEPGATVEPTTTTEPGVTTTPVTTEPAAAPTAQGPAPTAVEPITAAPEPAPAPEPVKAPAIPALKIFTSPTPPALPKSLELGKPSFTFGNKAKFDLKFESGIERALFHATKKVFKEKDPQYVQWLKDQGLTDTQIKDIGAEFRANLRKQIDERMATGATKGEVVVPRFVPAAALQAPVTEAPVAPTQAPAVAEPAPAAQPTAVEPPPTVQAQPSPPPPQVEPFVREPSQLRISKPFSAEIEQVLPGIGGIIREIQQNLFPGTTLRVVKSPEKTRFYGQSTITYTNGINAGEILLNVNIDRLRKDSKNEKEFKAKLLHTIFHEMAHPVEDFYVANQSPEKISAIMKQYEKDRNPSSMQRAFIIKGLMDLRQGPDVEATLSSLLKSSGMTRQQYENFLKDESKIITDPTVREQSFATKYRRSFSEWAAEKGAEFFTKNLENLVPKNTFEQFQKDILMLLRDLYSRIAKFLGMPDTEGAFEQLLKDTYGKVKKTPKASIEARRRLQARPEYILSGKKPLVEVSQRQSMPEGEVDIEAARKKIFADVPETRGRFRRFADTVREMYKQGGWRALAEGLAREVSDKYAPFMSLDKRFVDAMKAQGNEVAAGYDQTLPLAARLSSYASMLDRENTLAKLNTLLFQGGLPTYWTKDGDPKNLEGAIKVEGLGGGISFLPKLMKDGKLMNFAEYAVAKRALGTYAARGLDFQLSPTEAQALIDLHAQDPEIVQAYEQYQEFNKALINLNVAAGRISEKSAKEYLKYADFFPFHRFAGEDGRLTGPVNRRGVFDPSKIMQAKGGNELLQGDPIDMILKNAQFWLSSAQKNIAARKVYTMSEAIGEARQLSFTDLEKEQLADALYNGDDKEAGRHVQRERMLRPGEAEGSYYVDGVERRVALKHPDVAEALLATEAEIPDLFKGVFGTFTQGYRELVTRSPEFILSNLIRDSLGMPITSRVGFNIFRPIRMMYEYMKNKENNKTVLALMQWGAIGGYKSIPELDNASKLMNPNFNPVKGGIYVPESGKVLTDILAKAWNTLGELSDASDAAPRAAIYDAVMQKTGDDYEAGWRAQNAINYRKQGRNQLLRYLVVMVPFLNGRIQGLDVTARAFGSKEALIHTGIRGGYLLGAAMALQALVGDDEEYQQLPEYVRYGSLPVPLKLLGLGDTGFLAIPKPHELGFIFQTVPEVIYQSMLGNVETRNIARLAAEQLASTFGLSITPQVISPLVETFITNRSNLTGLPIVTEAMKNLPNELQYTSSTSQIVKDVAAATGISPVQAEALIKGYTGQIGTTVFGLMDSMYRSATGRGVDKNWTQYPVVQKFLKDSSNTNPQGVADVYRLSGEIQGLTTALNTFLAQGSVDKAQALVENNKGLFDLKPAISQLRTQLNTLSRNERMIVNNQNISQDQKEDQLQMIRDSRRIIGKQMTDMIERTGK